MGKIEVISEPRTSTSKATHLIAEGISEIWQEGHNTRPYLSQAVTLDGMSAYVESTDGDIVGVVCYTIINGTMVVELLYVEPSSRRLGIGTALLETAYAAARKARALWVHVDVSPHNKPANALLRKHGAAAASTLYEIVLGD